MKGGVGWGDMLRGKSVGCLHSQMNPDLAAQGKWLPPQPLSCVSSRGLEAGLECNAHLPPPPRQRGGEAGSRCGVLLFLLENGIVLPGPGYRSCTSIYEL